MQSADWRATARLLRRTGFGTTGPAVDVANRVSIGDHVPAVLLLIQRPTPARDVLRSRPSTRLGRWTGVHRRTRGSSVINKFAANCRT